MPKTVVWRLSKTELERIQSSSADLALGIASELVKTISHAEPHMPGSTALKVTLDVDRVADDIRRALASAEQPAYYDGPA